MLAKESAACEQAAAEHRKRVRQERQKEQESVWARIKAQKEEQIKVIQRQKEYDKYHDRVFGVADVVVARIIKSDGLDSGAFSELSRYLSMIK